MIKQFLGKAALLAATAFTLAIGPAAQAQEAGKIQVKLLGTAVLPDGKITKVRQQPGTILNGSNTEANDNVVPTLAIEYFFTPNVSVETICCLTQHDVDATGALAGAELVADAKILPATLTVKYHLPTASGIKPYVGAGPTYFIFIDEKSGAATKALGLPRQKMDDTVGFVLQAGVDVPVGGSGFGITLDAKRYFLRPDAHWYDATGAQVIETHHKLDPWVLSAGVAYRF